MADSNEKQIGEGLTVAKEVLAFTLKCRLSSTDHIMSYLEGDMRELQLKKMDEGLLSLCKLDILYEQQIECYAEIKRKRREKEKFNCAKFQKQYLQQLAEKGMDPKMHPAYLEFKRKMDIFRNRGDEELVITESVISTIDPITRKEMVEPMHNKKCKHTYEKSSIEGLLQSKPKGIKCPVVGCTLSCMTMDDLEPHLRMTELLQPRPSHMVGKYSDEFRNRGDEELIITESAVSTVDPITKKPIEEPMRNKKCNHAYEKSSIEPLLQSNPKGIKCPVVGCALICMTMDDLEPHFAMMELLQPGPSHMAGKSSREYHGSDSTSS